MLFYYTCIDEALSDQAGIFVATAAAAMFDASERAGASIRTLTTHSYSNALGGLHALHDQI